MSGLFERMYWSDAGEIGPLRPSVWMHFSGGAGLWGAYLSVALPHAGILPVMKRMVMRACRRKQIPNPVQSA